MSSSYIILQSPPLNVLPSSTSSRLKVTCFDITKSFLIIGSNSGTLHVLDAESLSLKYQIPTEYGSITEIATSPDECYMAVASNSGLVQIVQIPNQTWRVSVCSSVCNLHKGSSITALIWGNNQNVFIGDDIGRVSVYHAPSNKVTSLFLNSAANIFNLNSSIVQLDFCHQFLLVSSLTHSYICDTKLKTFKQIGTKRRYGEHGACFYSANNKNEVAESHNSVATEISTEMEAQQSLNSVLRSQYVIYPGSNLMNYLTDKIDDESEFLSNVNIFCCRPGFRMWKCDLSGTVLSTHQYKISLPKNPIPVVEVPNLNAQTFDQMRKDNKNEPIRDCEKYLSINKVFQFSDQFLLAVSTHAFFLINPTTCEVIFYTLLENEIQDVKINGNVFVYSCAKYIHKCLVTQVDTAIVKLHSQGFYNSCALLCLEFCNVLKTSSVFSEFRSVMFADLVDKLKDITLSSMIQALRDGMSKSESDYQPIEENCSIVEHPHHAAAASHETRANDAAIEKVLNNSEISTFDNDMKFFSDESPKTKAAAESNCIWYHKVKHEQFHSRTIPNFVEFESKPVVSYYKSLQGIEFLRNIFTDDQNLFSCKDQFNLPLSINTDEDAAADDSWPSYLVNFNKRTLNLKQEILVLGNSIIFKEKLTNWLQLYYDLGNGSQQLPKLTSTFKQLNSNVSNMLLLCMKNNIQLNIEKLPQNTTHQHSLTPSNVKMIDSFYSHLLKMSIFYDVDILIAGLHDIGSHLYTAIWSTLKDTICKNLNNSYRALHHRSRRILLITKYIRFHELQKVVEITTKTPFDPVSIHDLIYSTLTENTPEMESLILSYLLETNKNNNLHAIYTQYWRFHPEIQHEIISGILNSMNRDILLCKCGYPKPYSLNPCIEAFLETIFCLPLNFAARVMTLCSKVGYIHGVFQLIFSDGTQSINNWIPHVFQSMRKADIMCMIEYLDVAHVKKGFDILLKILSIADGDHSILCYHCDELLSVSPCITGVCDEHYDEYRSEQIIYRSSYDERFTSRVQAWDEIVPIIVTRIGCESTIKIISTSPFTPLDLLKMKFYQRLIKFAVADSFCESFSHSFSVCLSPKVTLNMKSQLIEHTHEAQNSTDGNLGDGHPSSAVVADEGCLVEESLIGDGHPSPLFPLKGSFSFIHHWGVRTNLFADGCILCHLGLAVEAMLKLGGVVVFPCGHAVHAVCLERREKVCSLCLHS